MKSAARSQTGPSDLAPVGDVPSSRAVMGDERWPGGVRLFLIVGLSAFFWTGIVYALDAIF